MTIKENLIKIIIDMDNENVSKLYEEIKAKHWENIEEVNPTADELKIINAYKNGEYDFD